MNAISDRSAGHSFCPVGGAGRRLNRRVAAAGATVLLLAAACSTGSDTTRGTVPTTTTAPAVTATAAPHSTPGATGAVTPDGTAAPASSTTSGPTVTTDQPVTPTTAEPVMPTTTPPATEASDDTELRDEVNRQYPINSAERAAYLEASGGIAHISATVTLDLDWRFRWPAWAHEQEPLAERIPRDTRITELPDFHLQTAGNALGGGDGPQSH